MGPSHPIASPLPLLIVAGVRLAALLPDRLGLGRNRNVHRRPRLRLGDGGDVDGGPRGGVGEGVGGEVDVGHGAHVAGRARPGRVVAG